MAFDPVFNLTNRTTKILVVIDSQVEDTENLLNGVIPGAKVILLNATEDGVRQITQALQENPEISQLHIISHGSPGSLQLGNTQLSLDTLPLYANKLQTWPVTRLVIYGCNVAAGDAGSEFIEKLHQLTKAETAASTTRTGDTALGGDWNFDVKTSDFDVILALSEEVQANYQFVFPEPISDINAPLQPSDETVTRSGLSPNGNPLTFNFGQGNNRVIVDFQDNAGDTFEAVEEDLLNTFALRRNNNDNDDGPINGRRQLIWFETEGPAANGVLDLSPEFPSAEDLTLMEEALSGSIINRGTDNVFSNTGNGQGNNNNVERIDYYVSDGGTLSISVGSNPNDFGFLILERGGNDPFQIAAITAIDNVDEDGDPVPSAYGPLVSFLDIPDDLNDDSNPWGISNIALNTAVLQRPDREIDPDAPLRNTSIGSGNVAGIFVSYEDLGIAAGETFFGYSLFPADIDDTFDLVDFESFPTDTPDDGEFDGGLDLIAGGVVFNRRGVNQPPIARNDIVVTEFNTPIDIRVLDDNDNDDNNDSADSDPDNSPDPISIIEESITTPANGTVAFDNNGTPDPSDDFITYTPNPGFVGEDTFEYAITDGQDNSQPATVTITVDPPATTTVSGNVFADSDGNNLDDANEDRLAAITVNLIDSDGDIVSVETSADGVYQFQDVVPGDYTVQVDTADTELPAGAILGTDNDIAVTVAGTPIPNQNFGFDIPPVANPDTATTPINTDVSFNVTTNDTDDGTIDPTTVDLDPADGQQTERTVDGVGTYSVDDTGVVTFTPEPGFTGKSTINYTVQDNSGLLSAPAAITVTVNPPANIAPNAIDDTATTQQDTEVVINVLNNDTDPENDPLSISNFNATSANNGTVTLSEEGLALVYTPADGFIGSDTFTYIASDGNGGTDTATVNVNVVESEEPIFTIIVDTPVDEDDNDLSIGDVSLRDALKAIPDGGTINFSNSLINETITLDAAFGELVVDKSVTINGLGDDQLTIDAAGNSRVFKVDDGNNTPDKIVTIDGLTITGGVASGSFPNGRGGGIDNRENLTVSNSTITGNSSNGRGGGISNYYSTANIANNTITGNSSSSSGGGISNLFSTANITNNSIIGNSATQGGGISSLLSTANITNNIITGNSAITYGGGILNNQTISTITNNIITVNSASDGGGVSNIESSITDISNSTISGNTASGGGGLYNFTSTANITNSTISGNSASVAGGIYNYGERSRLNMTNSTISGNSANQEGGGILISSETTATINNSTIIDNSAALGAGIFNQGDIVNIASTIVAGNANDNDIEGSSLFTSNGNNLIGNGDGASGFTDGVNGDIVGTSDSPIDPVLGPLQNNGGLSETHAILPGSPAINAGSNPLGLTTDQRGEARVQQGTIDIGAFESALLPNQPPNPNLEATNGDDSLVGTEGNDTIAGLLGNDEILGLAGDDVLRGDQNKRSPVRSQQGNDTIFGGAGDDRIGGKGGDDELYGDEGDDQIWGDDGDDILRGGLGNDTLTGDDFSGGQGSDTFILAPGEGTDTIVDFEVGIDLIGLAEGLTFSDLTLTLGTNEVSVNFGEETLATVLGVNVLTEADFQL